MVFKLGKVTVPRSMGGERATVDVEVTGMTSSGFALVSLAERDSEDYRGQMDFFVTCGTDKITITSEEKELQADTDVYYFACDNEIDGALLADDSVDTDQIADGAVTAAKLGDDVSSLTTVDDSTIELVENTLQVKDGGITAAKLADTLDLSSVTLTLPDDVVDTDNIADDAVNVDKLNVVVRTVTVLAEASTGTVTNAADIGGVVLGVYPTNDVESAILNFEFNDTTGAATVTLGTAQSAETPGTVTYIVLQA